MKKILFFLLLLSGVAQGQSRLYLRGDSIQMQSGTNAELILLNGSRTVTNGILTNIGNGRTKFLPIDSFDVGATLTPVGTGFDIGISGTSNVKRLAATNGITLDSATSNTVTARLGGTLTENTTLTGSAKNLTMTFDSIGTGTGLSITSSSTVNPGLISVSGPQKLFNVSLSGEVTGNNRQSMAAYLENKHTNSGGNVQTHYGLGISVKNAGTGASAYGLQIIDTVGASGGWGAEIISRAIGVTTSTAGGLNIITSGGLHSRPSILMTNSSVGGDGTANSVGIKSIVNGANTGGVANISFIASSTNADFNYAFIAEDGLSAFMTSGDTTHAILGVGPATTSTPSIHIEEGVAPTSPVDGDMWHTDDSLYFQSGGRTYNLTHLIEAGGLDWQSVLDNGTTFDKANTIEMDGFSLLFNNSGGFTVYDSAATAVSTMAFNQGFDFMTYTGIVGDTVYNFTQDIANGIKLYGTDGTETHFLQVKGNGIFASGLLFNDGAALRNLAIDTATGKIYTTALSSGSGANTALSNLASVAINEDLLPGADNSKALGSGSKTWADAYFGDGAVIDFNNGGYFMTHQPSRMQFKSGLGTQSLFVLMSPDGTDSLKLNADNGGGHILDYTGGMTIRRSNSTQLTFAASTLTSAITFIPRTGSTSAGSAPIKYASGTLMTSAEAGAKEYNGDHYVTKASNVRMGLGGALYNNATSASVTGSTEENLMTYSLPAATLDNDGDYIEIEGSFLVLTVGDKVIIKFGATKVVEWTTGNTGTYAVSGRITRTGATTQQAQFKIIGEDSGVMITTPAETLSGAITIAGAAQGTGVGDATMYNLNVKYYPTN